MVCGIVAELTSNGGSMKYTFVGSGDFSKEESIEANKVLGEDRYLEIFLDGRERLIYRVEELLKNGWELQGGISRADNIWVQALFKD